MGPLPKIRSFLARSLLLAGFAALLFAARPAMAVGPSTVYVDDGYVGLPNGTSVTFPWSGVAGAYTIGTDAFATIEGGVDAVVSGGTVRVAAGTYSPTYLTLNKAVTLSGAQAGVDGRTGDPVTGRGGLANESVINTGGSHTFDLAAGAADHITFDGFYFSNFASRTIDAYYYANYFTMKNCILTGSIEGPSPVYETGAIQFNGDFTRVDADYFTFEQNLVTTDDGHLLDFNRAMNYGVIRNNKFKCDSVAFGPFTEGGVMPSYWTIEGNEFDGNVGAHGAYWGWGFNSDFENSVIRNNNVHQMWLGFGQVSLVGGLISGNTFNDNQFWAIMLWGSQYSAQPTAATKASKNVVIQNNTFNYNGVSYTDYTDASHGVWLRQGIDATSVHIRYNTFRDLNLGGGGLAGDVWAIRQDGSGAADGNFNFWNPVAAISIPTQAGQGAPVTAGHQGLVTLSTPLSVAPTTIAVSPPANLSSIIATAHPGDVITIADGSYNGGQITVSGGVVTVNFGNLNLNGSFIGQNFVVGAGAGLSGNSTINRLNLYGSLRPGNSPGLVTVVTDATLAAGGSYVWEINDAAGTAGVDPGWDLLNVVGALNITATAGGGEFTVNVNTLTLANVTGNPANFDGTVPLNWTIATAGGGITGFAANKFIVDSSAVPAFGGGTVYKFTIQQAVNDIQIHFEPNVIPQLDNPIPDQSGTYGYAFSFQFAANTFSDPDVPAWPQTLTYSASGMPPGIIFTPATRTFSGTPTTPVGTYPVTVRATDNGVPVKFVEDTFNIVIAPAPLSITANVNKQYGTTLTLGAGQTTFTPTGLRNGDTIGSVTLSAISGPPDGTAATDPVGNYILRPSLATGGTFTPSDYNISYVDGTLAVTKAPLNVTAGDRRKQQGVANDPAPFTYTITGFVNGETSPPVAITGTPVITTTVVTATAAGAYPISVDVSGMSADNYSFVGVAGTYDVMTVLALPYDMAVGDRGPSVEKGTITLLSGATAVPPNTQYVITTAIKSPYEIDLDPNRNYVVVDNADYSKTFNTFGVWRIDKNTLVRTLISRGGSLVSPMGVKIPTNGPVAGKYVVVDSDAYNDGANQWGAVIIINPALPSPGNQTVLSSRLVGAGPTFYWPLGAAMAPDGNSVYVSDQGEPTDHAGHPGRIFNVNLTTGARTVLFTATVGATTNMCQPVGLAVESDGSSLVVADPEGQRLLRVTIPGAVLSTVSSTNIAPFIYPTHVAIRKDTGNYIVTDARGIGYGLAVGGRHIFEVDKATGAATVLTTDGFLEQPRGVVIVP